MKHFNTCRRFILTIGTVLAAVLPAVCYAISRNFIFTLIVFMISSVICVLLFLIDYIHRRYTDDLLEQLALLIENLVGQQELILYPVTDDTLLSRLQHQLLKLRGILISQNKLLESEKNQIKTLISDISHQIKTPVAAAKTFSELLNDDELSYEERDEYILALQASLNKLTFLTDSLIKMSRLESGIINLKPEKILIHDIVLQSVKSVCSKAKEKNITITFENKKEYEIFLDFNWTAEAIANVLDNAVKYTQVNGKVDIKLSDYPSYLRLDIQDNGPGIAEEEQSKIFGRFYRGMHASGAEGVGIGLYLTREIINRQNGYIKVEADESGSLFSLFFRKTGSDL